MATVDQSLLGTYESMRQASYDRRMRGRQLAFARAGNVDAVMPDIFPTEWPRPIIANELDTSARSLAEITGRMPTVQCITSKNVTERAKKFAGRKSRIVQHFMQKSRMSIQMVKGADWYYTYGALVIVTEPDLACQSPCLRVDNPLHAVWDTDLYGNVTRYAVEWDETIGELGQKFPELYSSIRLRDDFGHWEAEDGNLRVVKWYDKTGITLFLPDRQGLVLTKAPLRLGRIPVRIAERPSWDDCPRGQFDDVLWVWLAKARLALYSMEATKKAVQAPIAMPDDADEIAFGPDSIIRSSNPQAIRRVPLELPQSALVQGQILEGEFRTGSRIPGTVSGADTPSIVTGPGMAALVGSYSTQVATAQTVIGQALQMALYDALEMDQLYWPDVTRPISGTLNGAPFSDSYRPDRDIAGDYSVVVSYGMTAGLDPSHAIVFLLQLRADQAIDRATMQQQLPFELDIEEMQRRVDIEQMEDAMKSGVFALLANAPSLGLQGADVMGTLQKAAAIIAAREKGTPFHQAVLDAFKPPANPAPQSPADALMAALGQGQGGAQSPNVNPNQSNSQLGPGGSPDLSLILAGLTPSGSANLQANVSRRIPAA